MKAFVTGATGFVGSHLVEALLAQGYEVVCLVRQPERARALFGDRVQCVTGSLEDHGALRNGCTGADVVFHLAGLTAARTEAEFFKVNRDGTERLVKAAEEASPQPKRLVYVSSLAAAGPSRRGRPAVETDPPHPVSIYGWSKLAGEEVVRRSSLSWTIVRPPAVYGPRDRGFLKFFQLAQRRLVPLIGKPDQELSLIYAADLAAALVACAQPNCSGRTYFASHPEIVLLRQAAVATYRSVAASKGLASRPVVVRVPGPVARSLLGLMGWLAARKGKASILSADKARELLAESWTCSPAALERDTGWKAATDLESGLRLTARWYQEHGWL